MTDFAPKTESYLPEPRFKFSPPAREVDFAQLVSAGQNHVEALLSSGVVTRAEYDSATRQQLHGMATRLLSSPAIQERIDYFLVLHKASMDLSVERLQQELTATAYSDFAQLFHKEDGPPVPDPFEEGRMAPKWRAGDPVRNPHDLPRHIRAAVKEWGFDKDGCLKAKFHDKLKAAQMLGDLQGYFLEADRAKAPQINIAIGDGLGQRPSNYDNRPPAIEVEVIEQEVLDLSILD